MRLFLALLCSFFSISMLAQNEYTVILEQEEIKVSYQVLEVKKNKALIPEIRLSIENLSDSYAEVSFELYLDYDMEVAEIVKVEGICVAPGKTKKGKIKGMFYNPENLTLAQLQSEVEYRIEEWNKVTVAKCK